MPAEDNEQLKKMVANLAQVINHTLSTSAVVRQAVDSIRQNGYEVDLSLAACIGVYKEASPEFLPVEKKCNCSQKIKFEFDQEDLEFLKSLNLRLAED